MKTIFTIVAILFFPLAVLAVDPGEILKDPNLERRARSISKGLRCVVCQNQSIDDSDAQLARDLRILVRNRIVAGDSDTAVIDYVVSRYGDFVLLKPPVKGVTLVLWFGPIFFTLAGLIGLILFFRRQRIDSKALVQMDNKEINN
jgi:cytochrome c-type biogenesis protein CcmH